MGDYKSTFGYSRMTGWGYGSGWVTAKREALEEYNDPHSPSYHQEGVLTHYNEDFSGHPITDDDKKQYEATGTWTPSESVETTAIKQTENETALAWEREKERKAAQKKAEALLENQPDYTIPESVQAYVGMMTDIGNLLGGITDASGGGSPSYTAKPYTVKNVPGYGDKPLDSPSYADDMSAKIRGRGVSDLASLLAAVSPTQKQTF